MNWKVVAPLLMLVGGCATSMPAEMKAISLKAASEPMPACESGHDDALVGGVLSIRPGQVICVELGNEGAAVVPVKIVSTRDPKNTLVLSFRQHEDSNNWVLSLYNPLSQFLQYKVQMHRPGQSGFEETSNCPVLSHRLGIEFWPHPIDELRLQDFSAIPESTTMECG
jgi:hypothetical protein